MLQGVNDLKIACSAMSGDAAACEEAGTAAQRAGDVVTAEEALRRALTLEPKRRSALGLLTRLLLEQRRGVELIPVLERVSAVDPADLRARTDLGNAYLQAGRMDEARRAFETVLDRDPRQPVALATLGSIREQQGDRDDAARLYERYLEIGPREDSLTQAVRARLDRLRRGL